MLRNEKRAQARADEIREKVEQFLERLYRSVGSAEESWRELAEIAGSEKGALRRTFNSNDLSAVGLMRLRAGLSLAFHLMQGEAAAPAATGHGNSFRMFHYSEREEIAQFHLAFGEASNCITFTEGIDSYLTPDEMTMWGGKQWVAPADFEQWQKWSVSHIEQQRLARQSDVRHHIICPEEFLRKAANVEPGWIEELVHGVIRLEALTLVHPVVHWNELKKELFEFLPEVGKRWEKVALLDGRLLLIRLEHEYWLLTESREVIDRFKAFLERSSHFSLGGDGLRTIGWSAQESLRVMDGIIARRPKHPK